MRGTDSGYYGWAHRTHKTPAHLRGSGLMLGTLRSNRAWSPAPLRPCSGPAAPLTLPAEFKMGSMRSGLGMRRGHDNHYSHSNQPQRASGASIFLAVQRGMHSIAPAARDCSGVAAALRSPRSTRAPVNAQRRGRFSDPRQPVGRSRPKLHLGRSGRVRHPFSAPRRSRNAARPRGNAPSRRECDRARRARARPCPEHRHERDRPPP